MPAVDFTQVFTIFLVLVCSLSVHEAAHAWSADRLGDPTARLLGRVSLNPAVHVDLIGTIVFPLVALIGNAPLLGWAKPVPVNVSHLRGDWKKKYMLIAAAGPISNLVLAIVAALCLRLVAVAVVESILLRTVQLNVLLAVFNMVPVPPLDGGNVLSGLLRGPMARGFDAIRPYGFLILYGLMFSGGLFRLIDPPSSFLLSWLL